MSASGISSELRAHQMAPGGVVAHSSPPAGVVAQVVRSLYGVFRSRFLRLVFHFRTSSPLVSVLGRAYEEGARHRCWSDISSGELLLLLLLCVLRARPLRYGRRPCQPWSLALAKRVCVHSCLLPLLSFHRVSAPGPYCGAEERWRNVGLTVSASV